MRPATSPRSLARPFVLLPLLVVPLLQACGGGGGGGGGESRADIIASIPEGCRFLGEPAFELSDQELRDVRDAGCLVPSPGGDTAVPPTDVAGAPPVDDEPAPGSVPDETAVPPAADALPPVVVSPDADGEAGPADVDGSSFLITGNNSARLTGERFGRGTDANIALRRSIPVRLATPSADLEIEAAHVIGRGEFFNVVLVVTNRANATLCDIDLGMPGLVDRTGEVFTDEDSLFGVAVEGSAARTPSGRLETRCLAPGETSYGIEFSPDGVVAEDVVAVVVPAVTVDDAPVEPALSRIVPTGYALDGGGLLVTIRNEGLIDVESGYVVLIVLDENGYPLDFSNDFAEDVLPAGGEGVVAFPGLGIFSGRADTIRVIAGYNDVR